MAQFVEKCATRPMHCSGFPQLGARHRKGYWDMGVDLDREHVYWSVEGVEDRARAQGWASPQEMEELRAHVYQCEQRLGALAEENARLLEFKNAVDVMASADFVARRKPGPPRVEA